MLINPPLWVARASRKITRLIFLEKDILRTYYDTVEGITTSSREILRTRTVIKRYLPTMKLLSSNGVPGMRVSWS